jgi:hypothetical protein
MEQRSELIIIKQNKRMKKPLHDNQKKIKRILIKDYLEKPRAMRKEKRLGNNETSQAKTSQAKTRHDTRRQDKAR